MCVGCGDDERPDLVVLGRSSGLSVSFFVPFLVVAFAVASALGAGADELLDAPVRPPSGGCGGSCTAFNGNGVGKGCAFIGGLAFALTVGRGESTVAVLCFPFPVIRRFASC